MMHKEKLNPASVNEDVSFLIEGNKGAVGASWQATGGLQS